jgi:hypothetical protein
MPTKTNKVTIDISRDDLEEMLKRAFSSQLSGDIEIIFNLDHSYDDEQCYPSIVFKGVQVSGTINSEIDLHTLVTRMY